MLHHAKQGERLMFRSMGKVFAITAIATSDEEANRYLAKHSDEGVIASFGPFVLMANLYDGMRATPLDASTQNNGSGT